MGLSQTFALASEDTTRSYVVGLLVQLGCTITEVRGPTDHLVTIELPDGWSFHQAPDWLRHKLHRHNDCWRNTLIRSPNGQARVALTEYDTSVKIVLAELWALERFEIRGDGQGSVHVLDLAAENQPIKSFEFDSENNFETARDWLDVNYPDWQDESAYWDD